MFCQSQRLITTKKQAGNTMTKKISMFKHLPFKIFVYLFAVPLLLSGLTTASARPVYEYWHDEPVYQEVSPVTIDFIEDSGRRLNQYVTESEKPGIERRYLEARKGARYQIRVRNHSDRRIGLVIAVDGRNILTGKKSWLRHNEKMYILDPYETSTYRGWRTAKNQINRFYFTSAADSYAEAFNDQTAMGVIAIAVFEEKYERPYQHRIERPYGKNSPDIMGRSKSLELDSDSAGTGFGREEYSPTRRVRFKAKHQPLIKYFYKYEWRRTLCEKGIIDCYDKHWRNRNNNRFWPDDDNRGYAPYPPGYYRR